MGRDIDTSLKRFRADIELAIGLFYDKLFGAFMLRAWIYLFRAANEE